MFLIVLFVMIPYNLMSYIIVHGIIYMLCIADKYKISYSTSVANMDLVLLCRGDYIFTP